jgi:hypothetical protein
VQAINLTSRGDYFHFNSVLIKKKNQTSFFYLIIEVNPQGGGVQLSVAVALSTETKRSKD